MNFFTPQNLSLFSGVVVLQLIIFQEGQQIYLTDLLEMFIYLLSAGNLLSLDLVIKGRVRVTQ